MLEAVELTKVLFFDCFFVFIGARVSAVGASMHALDRCEVLYLSPSLHFVAYLDVEV